MTKRTFRQFLAEKEEQKKMVFKETDGRSAFPQNTMSALRKEITKMARDLDQSWDNAAKLISSAFEANDVPIPQAFQSERWEQYKELVDHTMRELYKARGSKGF